MHRVPVARRAVLLELELPLLLLLARGLVVPGLALGAGQRDVDPLVPCADRGALLEDLGDDAGADGAAALADREAHLLLETDRRDELDRHRDVVARHDHLGAFRQLARAGHVRRAHVELRAVVGEERRVTAALFLLQDVDLALELLVRRDRARLAPGSARARRRPSRCRAADTPTLSPAWPSSSSLRNISTPVTDRLARVAEADDLDLFARLHDAALDAARRPPCRGP